jgi:hypothetical protein
VYWGDTRFGVTQVSKSKLYPGSTFPHAFCSSFINEANCTDNLRACGCTDANNLANHELVWCSGAVRYCLHFRELCSSLRGHSSYRLSHTGREQPASELYRLSRRNLVPTFVDRGVSRGQFSRSERLLLFQVAPHLSSQGLSGPRSRPTATQKNLVAPGIKPGTTGLAAFSLITVYQY